MAEDPASDDEETGSPLSAAERSASRESDLRTHMTLDDGWVWGAQREHGDTVAPSEQAGSVDEPARSAVINDVIDYYSSNSIQWNGVEPPAEPFIRDSFFDFSHIDETKELDRYWVHKPYSFVSILHDVQSQTNYYHISEPVLDEVETYLKDDLSSVIRDTIDLADLDESDSKEFEKRVRDGIADHAGGIVDDGSLHKLTYYLLRDFIGYGRIDPIMLDDQVEDISCDGNDVPLFVYHRDHRDLPTNLEFDAKELDTFVRWLAQRVGRPISFSNPVVSGTLPRGDRAQLMLGSDISYRGANFTIRRYQKIPFTPVDLVRLNTFSLMEMAFVWLCIEHQKSMAFVGPTASGKTTSMNASSLFIRPYSKVVTIERTRELSIPHDNWVSTVTREFDQQKGASDVSMADLLHSALHQRPEYILIGEIRTEVDVLQTFLQSVFTGHAGYTTFHAHDVEETIARFRGEPFDADDQMIASIDFISVQRQVYIDDERFRRNIRISELEHTDEGIETTDVFVWDPETDTHRQRVGYFELRTLREIADEHGWNEVELLDELDRRRDFLDYLVRNGVTDYRNVWAAIFAFSRDRETVMDKVRDGTFDPGSIKINYYD